MRKTHLIFLSAFMFCTACTTLDQSFKLGATTGAFAGAAESYGAVSSVGRTPTLEEVATDRETSTRQTEIYFGDLPPSPFIIPSLNQKKGGR
jgi:hypothetical protein